MGCGKGLARQRLERRPPLWPARDWHNTKGGAVGQRAVRGDIRPFSHTVAAAVVSCGAIHDPIARGRAAAAIAATQHGVLTHAQLITLGISAETIKRWLRRGLLHRLHRGVYLYATPKPHRWTYEMAAALACGDGAFLSHSSAACLWHLLPQPADPRPVEVTVAGRDPGQKPGIRIHRVKHLHPSEARRRHRIPLTSPARTLLDLAATTPAVTLERATAEAFAKRLVRHSELATLAAKHPRHRGTKRLRAIVTDPPAITKSQAEHRLLALIRRARLPDPEVNARLDPYVVDFLWRAERLIVEVDGFAFHSSRPAFERDRRRDAELVARDFRVLRFTWRQLIDEPEVVIVRIAQALATR